jgi:co-chaperonin GroES (HSP10)
MPTRIKGKITPLKKRVLVSNMHFGLTKTKAGLIIPDDDGKAHGTHPRWAKVYAVGKDQTDVNVGEWVLISHGRWTRGITLETETEDLDVRMIDEKDILLTSKDEPDINITTAPYKA